MKIVCESCGAKYSIADEKVAGKVFKIRCKRCSEVIVVRGDEQGQQSANGGYSAQSAEAAWHVVINGEQAGPYTVAQLSDMLAGGTVDWEAYVWTEGFDNWMPMRDVEDLVAQITGQTAHEQQPAAAAAGGYAAAAAGSLDAQPSMGADPFAEDSVRNGAGMFAATAAPAAAPGPDLFGGAAPAASSFEGGGAQGVVASSPSPRVSSEQAMTGARNENSVLFSLKNLQALATGGGSGGGAASMPAPTPTASSGGAGFAGGEGSGLIDIRALASATGVGESRGEERDELLSMGSPGGAFGAMASPMLAPAADSGDSNKTALYVALVAAAGFLALAAVAVVYIMRPQPAPVAQPAVAAPAPAAATATAVPGAQADPAPAQENQEPPSEGELAAKAAAEEAETRRARDQDDDRDREQRRRKSRGSSESARSSKEEAPKAAEKPAPKEERKSSGPRSLDDLLDSALTGKPGRGAASATAEPASNLPDKPSRDAVLSAMNGVKDAVQTCAKGQSGVAFVNVTVAGKTGRVTNAQVSGITGPAGSCIAKAVRRAKFPPFKSSQFMIKYPFRL